jgi:hypothetical protein
LSVDVVVVNVVVVIVLDDELVVVGVLVVAVVTPLGVAGGCTEIVEVVVLVPPQAAMPAPAPAPRAIAAAMAASRFIALLPSLPEARQPKRCRSRC